MKRKVIVPRVVIHKSNDRYIGRNNQIASPSVTIEAVFIGLTQHQIEKAYLLNQAIEENINSLWYPTK